MLMGIREETAFTRGLLPLEVVESQALCAMLEEVTNRLLHLHKPLRSSDEDVAATTTTTTPAMEDDDDTQHYVFYSPPDKFTEGHNNLPENVQGSPCYLYDDHQNQLRAFVCRD